MKHLKIRFENNTVMMILVFSLVILFMTFMFFKVLDIAPEYIGRIVVEPGNVSHINLTGSSKTPYWNGVYGNLTPNGSSSFLAHGGEVSGIKTGDTLIINHSEVSTIFLSTLPDIDFNLIMPADPFDVDTYLGVANTDFVSGTMIFTQQKNFTINNADYLLYYMTTYSPDNIFDVAILKQGHTLIFMGVVNHSSSSFDNQTADFQMMVPVRNMETPRYYAEFDPSVIRYNNTAPVIPEIDDLSLYVNTFFYYKVRVTDAENDNLTFYSNSQIFKINPVTGVISFYPSIAHLGEHNFTITVRDWLLQAAINVTATVYHCGDAVCNTVESCKSCPEDCGECTLQTVDEMAIIIDSRNCYDEFMDITVYKLWSRATCPTEGIIVEGYETCETLSKVSLTVLMKNISTNSWKNAGEFVTDENGETGFTPGKLGLYRLVAKKSAYPDALVNFEVDACLEDEDAVSAESMVSKDNVTGTMEEDSEKDAEQETPGFIGKDLFTLRSIMLFGVLPAMIISLGIIIFWSRRFRR